VTQGSCLSASAIASLICGEATADDRRHARLCTLCSRRVALVRRVTLAGIDAVAETVAEVDDLTASLVQQPRNTWWKIVREPEYRRPDIARRLLALAVDARLRDLPKSIELANCSTTILARLPSTAAAELRFEAWKFTSAVLREAGRYDDTVAACAIAEEAARATSDPDLALASVSLSRALLASEPDVWTPVEAMRLLDHADQVFGERGDSRAYAARTARALLLFRSGDIPAARALFAVLLNQSSGVERESYLDALSNLTWVRVELRESEPEVEEAIDRLISENLSLRRQCKSRAPGG
jgi:hypothetical protein